nr:helix-turn-helix transcriptional regulator [uncultured Oscillibacter sp.]
MGYYHKISIYYHKNIKVFREVKQTIPILAKKQTGYRPSYPPCYMCILPFSCFLWDITIRISEFMVKSSKLWENSIKGGGRALKVYDLLEGRRNVSGERVRQMRTKKRLTQADLAAKVQTTGVILEQDAISRIESGGRMVQDYELRALAAVLGVTSDWLLEDEEK